MLTKEESRKLAQKVLSYSKFPECDVSITDRERSFLRFANNGVTTAGLTIQRTVEISSTRGGRTGASQTTQFDDESLAAAVRRSEELAEIAPVNPERVEPLGPQKYSEHDNWDERTAAARSDMQIPQVRAVIESARSSKLVAAGFFDRVASISAIANKKGNFGYARVPTRA
jgi:predicted Zn-dependent protease